MPAKKLTLKLATATAACLAVTAAHATTVLQVNLGPAGLPAESGFTAWTTADKTAPGPTTINGIGLSFIGSRNDSATPNNIIRSINRAGDDGYAGSLAALTQTWWGVRAGTSTSGGFITIAINGSDLGANTYDWTSWHHDHQDQTGIMDIEVSVDGGANYSLVVDDLDIVAGDDTVAHDGAPNPAAFQFTSNGSDDVYIRFVNDQPGAANSTSFTLVNGFQLDLVPEPSSLALLGLGGLLIARRRRG